MKARILRLEPVFLKMGQKIGKKVKDKGHQLYKEGRYEDATLQWSSSLKRLSKSTQRREKFDILRNLCRLHFNMGKYREFLYYADQQIELSSSLHDSEMTAEALLNLARGNERQGNYNKALIFCRKIQTLSDKEIRLSGYVHLCLGNSYFGISDIANCCKNLNKSLEVARNTKDKELDILANISYGLLFVTLKDYDNGLYYYERALDTIRGIMDQDDVIEPYRRMLDSCLAIPYFRRGRCTEAMEICEVSLVKCESTTFYQKFQS